MVPDNPCQEMNAPFLLDNNYKPALPMKGLYEKRIEYYYACNEYYSPDEDVGGWWMGKTTDDKYSRCLESRIE